MSEFVPWNSQPIDEWSKKYAQGKTIDLDGKRTHYIEKGAGDPVILLHGFFYDSFLWADNIEQLAKKHKVYALDLWGSGYSTREPLDYGYQLFVDQVVLFMDALGIERASFVGQSMGAGTAIKLCVQHRSRVNRLVLVSAAGIENSIPFMAKIVNLPRLGEWMMCLKSDFMRAGALESSFIYDKKRLTQDYIQNVTRAHKIEKSVTVFLEIQRKQFFDKLTDEIHSLAQMDVPVLLVWGAKDKAVPLSCGRKMHQILTGSRLEILENAGHVANFECADEFNRLALDFLTNLSG